jgi:hypothetical protein
MDYLKEYADVVKQLNELNARKSELEGRIKEHVNEHGAVTAYGFECAYKAGRATTNHELAVTTNIEQAEAVGDTAKVTTLKSLIEQHSITKTTTSWAKVTGAMKIDIKPFTQQGDSTFTITQKEK